MELLTKEQQTSTWTREQARTFISRVCGISAAAAGLIAITTLLFVNH